MQALRSWLIICGATAALLACGSSNGGDDSPDAAGAATDQQLAEQFCQVEYGCFPDDWPSEQDCVDGV